MADEPEGATAPQPDTTPESAAPLVYLDVDDEITSAAARIRSADAERVTLVLPYGSRLATSRINFRLLAREAAERGKRIEIVCADSSARALAGAAGLTVHPSVAAYEAHRTGVAIEPEPDGADAGANGAPPSGEGAAARGPAPAAPEREEETATRVLPTPRRKAPNVPLVGPPRPPLRTGLAAGIGLALVVLVAAAAILAVEVLPAATIVLAPRSEPVGPVALSVEARLDTTAVDPANLVIPAERLSFPLEASYTITPTGFEVVDTKATGNVTFSNLDPFRSKRIDAGAIVQTEPGVEFALLADVTLPEASIDFSSGELVIIPSTSTVAVEATVAGPEGNVEKNTIIVVPKGENKNSTKVTNQEATSGGAHTEIPEVSQRDVDTALLALDDALADDLGRQVEERVGVPAGITLFQDTLAVGSAEYSVDPASLVGSPELEVELTATAQGTVLGVDSSPIRGLAESRLQAEVDAGWTLATGATEFSLGTPMALGDVVSYPFTIGGMQIRNIDQAALVSGIRGLVLAEARSRLDDYGDVEVTLWPDWVTTIPRNLDRITFTLAEPRPAPSPTP